MVKIKSLGFGILILLLMVNTCSAGFSLSVSPVDNIYSVSPGESISYNVIVNDSELFMPENVTFSINRTSECPGWLSDVDCWNPDWDYTFNPSQVKLETQNDYNVSILTIEVPADATPGKTYYHAVEAKALNELNYEMGGGIVRIYVTHTDVNNIPEFPTIAVPVIAVLGLVTMFGRRNNKD